MSISTVYKVINDVDDKVYIGSTTCAISKRMSEHRKNSRRNNNSKLYNHMRALGVQHFKIVCIREYTDISKERLHNREEKYIKRYDSIKNGLNMHSMGGYYCIHDKLKRCCVECKGPAMCVHKKVKRRCVECKGLDICVHNKVKYNCIDCNGSFRCIHEKSKHCCKLCNPATCNRCGKTYAGKQSLRTHQIKCQVDQTISTE
jgi:hypothetical protein